jgi:hypothetical protein
MLPGDKFDIIWRERKNDKRNIISQTEFIVHDKQNPTNEDFLSLLLGLYPDHVCLSVNQVSDISLVSIVSGSMLLSTLTEVPSLMRV